MDELSPRIYEKGTPQVYQRSGVSSRGSTDVGNRIHSQLKKDEHDRPRREELTKFED